jgi:hypothetical protein
VPTSKPLSPRRARELHAKAQADDQPTPREAMATLLADRAAELARLEAERDKVYDELRALALRSNYVLDDQGRGLPERHPDRFSLNDLVAATGKHRTTVNHWLEELIHGRPGKPKTARPDLIPTYKLTSQAR